MAKAKGSIDLRNARILVTNDDGINAPGIKILEKVARSLCRDVWVVAPEVEQSGASHALTIRRPLQVRKVSRHRFAVEGTPTDCVLLAVNALLEGRRPDLVLSGINRGANLGEDVHYSGTVAAAMEATLLGIPAVAMSQLRTGQVVHWSTAEAHAATVVKKLAAIEWQKGVLINVNFPTVAADAVTGIRATRMGRRVAGIEVVPVKDPVGRPYLWIGDFTSDESAGHGTDLEATMHGAISVTPLHVDLTHGPTMRGLAAVIE
ncbi:MAG: 5'/3'-nucleotidase SurE [Dongiaceae bacterium]